MKNLTLKKVAIGLLLAGYSISGAYAADSITTGIIKGRAPLVNAKNKTTAVYDKNSITVKLFDKNGTELFGTSNQPIAQVTNDQIIRIYFNVVDQDGDKDPQGLTHNTVSFGYNKIVNANQRTFTWVSSRVNTDSSGNRYAELVIPADAVGSNIYYEIRANTEYGNPYVAEKYAYGDVFSRDDAGTKDNSGGDEPTNPKGGAGGDDVPVINNPIIGIDPTSVQMKLYYATLSNGVITYGTEVAPNASLVVEQEFAPKVFQSINNTDVDVTEQFKFQWNLVDLDTQIIVNANNSGNSNITNQVQRVDDLAAVNAKLQGNTPEIVNLFYKIPLNSEVKAGSQAATVQGLAAGAQGYKLQVVAKSTTN